MAVQQPSNQRPNTDTVDGYTVETNYTYGYFAHLSPSWLRLALLNLSVPFPDRQPLRYLELGYGNGISLNIHAAAHPGDYWGTDCNPSHASFAAALAKESGANIHVLDLSFTDLLRHDALPDFDVIVVHGVWSWISDANRAAVVELARGKLTDGGVFCVSYAALPGAGAIIPLQRIMRLYSEQIASPAGEMGKLRAAINFLEKLAALSDHGYFAHSPPALELLSSLRTKNPAYLVHEYFSKHWNPALLLDVESQVSSAGLRFVGSANFIEHDNDWGVDSAGLSLLNSLDSYLIRETVRDYLINRSFRRDIFIKGGATMTPEMRRRELCEQAFVPLKPPDEVTFKVPGSNHRAAIRKRLYHDILVCLACEPSTSKSAADIANHLGSEIEEVLRGLLFLTQVQAVHPVQPAVSVEARVACQKLNKRISQECQKGKHIRALSSPITGSGIDVSPWHSVFEIAAGMGATTPSELTTRGAEYLVDDGQNANLCQIPIAARAVEGLRQAVLFSKSYEINKALEIINLDVQNAN